MGQLHYPLSEWIVGWFFFLAVIAFVITEVIKITLAIKHAFQALTTPQVRRVVAEMYEDNSPLVVKKGAKGVTHA